MDGLHPPSSRTRRTAATMGIAAAAEHPDTSLCRRPESTPDRPAVDPRPHSSSASSGRPWTEPPSVGGDGGRACDGRLPRRCRGVVAAATTLCVGLLALASEPCGALQEHGHGAFVPLFPPGGHLSGSRGRPGTQRRHLMPAFFWRRSGTGEGAEKETRVCSHCQAPGNFDRQRTKDMYQPNQIPPFKGDRPAAGRLVGADARERSASCAHAWRFMSFSPYENYEKESSITRMCPDTRMCSLLECVLLIVVVLTLKRPHI